MNRLEFLSIFHRQKQWLWSAHQHHQHDIIATTWDGPALRHSKVCRKDDFRKFKTEEEAKMEYRQLGWLNICFHLGKEVTDDHGWVQISEIKDGEVKVQKKNTCKAERRPKRNLKSPNKKISLKEEHLQGWTTAKKKSKIQK